MHVRKLVRHNVQISFFSIFQLPNKSWQRWRQRLIFTVINFMNEKAHFNWISKETYKLRAKRKAKEITSSFF